MFADRMNQKVSVAAIYVLVMFMSIMDVTIVNVALPRLGREFGVPAAHVNTVVVGYLVSLAIFIPVSGWLGDRYGTKRVLLGALVVFTAASALCGAAQSLTQLVLFRVLQGVGGGMLAPVGLAMLFRTFPPAERVRASRILIVPTALAPAIGPVLGGLLVTDISWRWVFYVNLPLGVLGVVFGALFVREQRHEQPGRFDLPGFLLSGVGFGSLMYGASEGPAKGWTSAQILTSLAIGVVLLAVLVRVETRTQDPMIDLRLLGNRLFRSCSLTMVLSIAAFLGSLFLVALFYQDGFGVSALQSGLSTFPEAIGIMVGAQIAGRIYPHLGPRRLMAGGLLGVAATLVLIATVPFSSSLWEMRALMFVIGLCQAHVFVPAQAAAFATVTPAATGRASTMFNAGRQLGGAVGVAVLSTVISAIGVVHHVDGHLQPNAGAYHAAFLVAAAIAVSAIAIVLRIVDADAAPTMKPKARSEAVAHPATPAEAGVA